MNIELNNDVKYILKKLNEVGEGFLVGGCLRDIAIGKRPKDFDFTTNLEYDKVAEIFKNYDTKEVGKAFGIITVNVNNENYEIARYRKDVNANSHYDTKVEFVEKIEDDLGRRDFTFNAMAYNEKRGLVDLFGGMEDIKNKIVKFIGDPDKRIAEDGLRILRAFRFASVLGFKLDNDTRDAISVRKDELKTISAERIGMEFNKILLGKNAPQVLEEMKNTGVLEIIVPELKSTYGFEQHNPHHDKNLWEHTLEVFKGVPDELELKYAALLHDIGKPSTQTFDENGIGHYYGHDKASADMAKNILKNLRQSGETLNNVSTLIENHMLLHQDINAKTMAKHIRKITPELFEKLIKLNIADNDGKAEERNVKEKLYSKFERALELAQPGLDVNTLALNGNEIMKFGYKGKEIGKMKENLLQMILDGKVKNSKNELLEVVKKIYKNNNFESEKKKNIKQR